jgi:hypothetical protein
VLAFLTNRSAPLSARPEPVSLIRIEEKATKNWKQKPESFRAINQQKSIAGVLLTLLLFILRIEQP